MFKVTKRSIKKFFVETTDQPVHFLRQSLLPAKLMNQLFINYKKYDGIIGFIALFFTIAWTIIRFMAITLTHR